MKRQTCYAILDIESTGGSIQDERIIEIAIYRYDGHDVVDKCVCLVNPERPIQKFVQKLTGITDVMVRRAPKFHEVAKRIIEITEGCVLIAHNADFDYRILRKEFKSLGYDYNHDTICTVELSKKLLPDQESYSLGRLCRSLGIPTSNRHRAEGDAAVTLELFKLLLEKDVDKTIIINQVKDFQTVIEKEKLAQTVQNIPQVTGLFYIHQSNGRIMYIGKGKNIKHSLALLLAKKSKKAKTIISKMSHVSYDETGSFILARLLFNQKMKQLNPRYNSNFLQKNHDVDFEHPNMILIDKAREINEKAVVLVKENVIRGYTYVNLDYQMSNPDILENNLIPLSDSNDNRYIISSSINKKRFKKIIKF